MKRAFFLLILLCSAVVMSAAPPSDESVLKMMNALQLQATLDQMVAQLETGMKAGFQQYLQGKELNPVQKAEVSQLQDKMSAAIKDEFAFAKVKDIYIQVYKESFTQDEVNSINAFYSSPAGKAMMEKIPGATKKASGMLQARMGPLLEKIKNMQRDFIKEQAK